ncbi:MAG: nicotinate-nicotinamide nucleotide adenylyltransferase, partial [Thermodesulfobacteriota bacterium]
MNAKIGILGGTFNPVHFGHLRLGIEALEQCRLDRVEFVPASIPPHKQGRELYPFTFRCRLLQEAIAGSSGLVVNPLEGERSGPSYTVDTIRVYHKRQPGARFFFVMGSEDFLQLEQWERWEDLPLLTSFI